MTGDSKTATSMIKIIWWHNIDQHIQYKKWTRKKRKLGMDNIPMRKKLKKDPGIYNWTAIKRKQT